MAESGFSRAEIVKMAEDTLRLLYAAQGLDFEAERAKRQPSKSTNKSQP
jgi:hypothetical protein